MSALAVGRDGSTWLRWPDRGEQTVRWEVLDPQGEPLRTVELERRAWVVDAGGIRVWAVVLDGPGEARLVRFRMEDH